MARIRSVHPGLFKDEAFMDLVDEAPAAVALLLGLWCAADDAGFFEWKPRTIKAEVLPASKHDVVPLLRELVRLNFVRQFEIGGRQLGVIRNFVRFQRPKVPKDVHPSDTESRKYAGFSDGGKRPDAGTGRPPTGESSEVVPTTAELAAQRKEEGVGDNSKTNPIPSCFTTRPAEARGGETSSEKFNKFWLLFPDKVGRSKIVSREIFESLSSEDQDAAIASIPQFVALTKSNRPTRPLAPEKFLRERRFATLQMAPAAKEQSIFVPTTSPDWESCRARYRAEKKSDPPPQSRGRETGWWFPSEWLTENRTA